MKSPGNVSLQLAKGAIVSNTVIVTTNWPSGFASKGENDLVADAVCCAGGDETVTEAGPSTVTLSPSVGSRVPEKPDIDIVSGVVGAVSV